MSNIQSNNLIAIAGLKGSGKDTAAHMLQYLLNSPKFMHSYFLYKHFNNIFSKGKYKIVSFAHPLKRTLAALLNVWIGLFDDRDFKENYYIFFPTITITNELPSNAETLSDSKFSKLVNNKDLSFIKTSWITIRQLLQVFGTECMRELFGDKLWILLTINNNKPTIVSDLRFKVELNTVKEKGGKVIYINRSSCIPGNHASEKEIVELLNDNKFDTIIDNNSDYKSLFNNLKKNI